MKIVCGKNPMWMSVIYVDGVPMRIVSERTRHRTEDDEKNWPGLHHDEGEPPWLVEWDLEVMSAAASRIEEAMNG